MICKVNKIYFERIKFDHSQTDSINLECIDLVLSSIYTSYRQYWNEAQTEKMKFQRLISKENQF